MARRTLVLVALFVVLVIGFNAAYLQSLPTTRHITVQAYDFFFVVSGVQGSSPIDNPTITVRTGDTIVLTLQNAGSKNDHEFFVLTKVNFDKYMTSLNIGENASEPEPAFMNGSVEDVPTGESKTGTFVVGQPGTYVYACLDKMGTEPVTHANKGMYGTFQVESGGLFSIMSSLGGTLGDTASRLTSIPSIIIWQVAILLSLVALASSKSGEGH
jgi:plastocyanin